MDSISEIVDITAESPGSYLELPMEIWSKIIGLLKRPRPPRQKECERSEITQPDLVSCMRVSKMFFDLTTPHLYTSPVVANLSSFFLSLVALYPLDDRPATASSTRLSTLGHVRNLHLVLDQIPTGILYSHLLNEASWWSIAACKGDTIKGNLLDNMLSRMTETIEKLCISSNEYLPNIHAISLGSLYIRDSMETSLEQLSHFYIHGLIPPQSMHHCTIQQIARFADIIASWFNKIVPPTTCLSHRRGPWRGMYPRLRVGHFRSNPEHPTPQTIYNHHCFINSYGGSRLPFLDLGTKNVYALGSPIGVVEDHITEMQFGDSSVMDLARNLIVDLNGFSKEITCSNGSCNEDCHSYNSSPESLIDGTTIEIYGYLESPGQSEKGAKKKARMLQKAFDKEAGIWKGRVTFHPFIEAPKCEGCGWDPRVALKEMEEQKGKGHRSVA